MGLTMAFRLTEKETGGAFSIADMCALPGAGLRYLHGHPAAETFIVLEGEFEFFGRENGKKVSTRMGPGSNHHAAPNAPHGVRDSSVVTTRGVPPSTGGVP